MPALQRDLDAYQSALDRYRLQVRQHNNYANQYNNSLLTDANGNAYVRDAAGNVYLADAATGQLSGATLPDGKTVADYGNTQIPDNNAFWMLRVNPTTQQAKTVNDVRAYTDPDTGQTQYYRITGYDSEGGQIRENIGPEYKVIGQTQVQVGYDEGGPIMQTVYTMQADDSIYANNPGAFGKTFDMKPPSVTAAQLNKMSRPSLATQERTGIIASEIIGGGSVLSGKVNKVQPPEKPPEVVDPVQPDPEPPFDPGTGWGP